MWRDPLLCFIRLQTLYKHFEGILSHDTAVLAETGDSWFNCQKLKLPNGCRCRLLWRLTLTTLTFTLCVAELCVACRPGLLVLRCELFSGTPVGASRDCGVLPAAPLPLPP